MVPAGILFDLDNTILNLGDRRSAVTKVAQGCVELFHPVDAAEIGELLDKESDRLWSDQAFRQQWRFKVKAGRAEIVRRAFASHESPELRALTEDDILSFTDSLHILRENQITCHPHAVDTLDALRAHGIPLALITNGEATLQRAKIERFGLEAKFDYIHIEGEHGFGKPDARTYHIALNHLSIAPELAWMVGDHPEWDIVGPKRLGIYSIWVNYGNLTWPPTIPLTPDRIISSLTDLLW